MSMDGKNDGMVNYNIRSSKNLTEKAEGLSNIPPGIYSGVVNGNSSNRRDGTINVFLDNFHKSPANKASIGGIQARYAGPFYGNMNINKNIDDPTESKKPITSYGMWTQAPEPGNRVLVAVVDGKIKSAFIVAYYNLTEKNKMIPGNAGDLTYQADSYFLPTVEKQPKDQGVTNNKELYPVNNPLSKTIVNQGLALDLIRGISSSSARREDASNIWGVLTKGRKNIDGKITHAGHSIVMDDGDGDANSKNIRIRTGGGNQILLDDDTGVIYLINKSGKAWVELGNDGSIHFFADKDINFRAKNNFNLRADKNINIESGQDINIMAAGDNDADGYRGRGGIAGVLGLDSTGFGHIKLHSKGSTSLLSEKSAQFTAQAGDIELSSSGRIMNDTGKFDVVANNIFNPALGGISLATTGSASIDSLLGSSMKSVAITEVRGATVQLNSLPAVPPPPPLPPKAQAATPLQFSKKQDQSRKAPEYNDSGEGPILPTGGKRPEKGDKIETIVSQLITAEPWSGHVNYDPAGDKDDKNKKEDVSVDKELRPGQIDPTDSVPADVDTPEGTKLGSKFSDTVGDINDKIGGIKDALSDARGVYEDVMGNPISAFLLSGELSLNGLEAGKKLASLMGITLPKLPSLPFQAQIDQLQDKVKQLVNFDKLKGMFSLDFLNNLPLDIKDKMAQLDLGNIENAISGSLEKQFGVGGDAVDNFKKSVGANIGAFNDAKAKFNQITGKG